MARLGANAQAQPVAAVGTTTSGLPGLPTIAAPTTATPTMGERPPFWLCWHPKRWRVEDGQVPPDLLRAQFRVGVNRMRATSRNGETVYHTEDMQADLRRRGYTPIPWDVDGPNTAYIEKCPGRPDVWLTRFETAHGGTDVVSVDHAGERAWRASLVERGVIPRPERHVLDALLSKHDANHAKNAENAKVSPAAAQRAERAERAAAVIRAALEASNVG